MSEVKAFVTGMQHIGIPTNDLKKTVAFFESLGFEVVFEKYLESTNEDVRFLRLGSVTIETYQNGKASMQVGAVDHIALDVTDIEAVYEKVTALGYQPLEDGIQFLPFWENGVRFFTIEGPDKEKVEFGQIL